MKKTIEKFAPMFVNVISKRLEQISENWEKPFFEVPKGINYLPQNIRGNVYRSSNAFFLFLLSEQMQYNTPVFLTFKQAQELKLHVKKGSKSFPVKYKSYLLIHKELKTRITIQEYQKLDEKEKENYFVKTSLKYYGVFNLDDTNYSEVHPEKWAELLIKFKKEEETQEELEGFDNSYIEDMLTAKSWLCPIYIKHSDNAFYTSSGDFVVMPKKEQFKTAESFYSTLLHEMAHSTGHESRLKRKLGNKFGSERYAHEELIAELSAVMTGVFAGVSVNIREQNVAYIASWLKKFSSNPEYLYYVMEDVSKASNLICETLKIEYIEEEILA